MSKVLRTRRWLRALPENPFVVCQKQAEARQSWGGYLWSNYGPYFCLLTIPLLLAISTARNFQFGEAGAAVRVAVPLLAFVQILYVALRAVMQTANSVVVERQRGTLLSLALTQVNSADYADGIMAASVRPVIREITVLLPLAALIGWFAGADAFSIVMLWCVSVLMAVIFGYLGVWISAGSNNASQAAHRAMLQTLSLLLLSPFLLLFAGFWAFPLWIVHPFVALGLAFFGLNESGAGGMEWMMLRWWAVLAIPIYLYMVTQFRRRAIRALERTHLI